MSFIALPDFARRNQRRHLAKKVRVSTVANKKQTNNMAAIKRTRGKTKTIDMPVTVSTAFSADSLVKFTSGRLVPCVAGDAAVDVVGIIRKAIAATDADYAVTRNVPIEVPVEKHVLYEMEVGTGAIAVTDLGTEYDLAGPLTVDQSATTDKVVKLLRFISTTKGEFLIKFNGYY